MKIISYLNIEASTISLKRQALMELFEGWIAPSMHFSAEGITEEKLAQLAYQFYMLNAYASDHYEVGPKLFIQHIKEKYDVQENTVKNCKKERDGKD